MRNSFQVRLGLVVRADVAAGAAAEEPAVLADVEAQRPRHGFVGRLRVVRVCRAMVVGRLWTVVGRGMSLPTVVL